MLVGDGGEDWLQLAPGALRLWEQVPREAALMTRSRWSLMRFMPGMCLALGRTC